MFVSQAIQSEVINKFARDNIFRKKIRERARLSSRSEIFFYVNKFVVTVIYWTSLQSYLHYLVQLRFYLSYFFMHSLISLGADTT